MGINSVSVVSPSRAQSSNEKKPEESTIDKIMKGLQIANGVLGMGVSIQSIRDHQSSIEGRDAQTDQDADKYAFETSERERKARGEVTPLEEFALREKGGIDAPAGAGNSTPLTRVVNGQKTPLQLAMAQKPEPTARAIPTRLVETVGSDGRPVQQIVEDKPGASFASVVKPDKPPKDMTMNERNTLQTQYDRDPEVRKTKEVLNSYGSVQALVKNPSPASDQALVYSYMKALDPGSVVRETEAESVAALDSLKERAKAQYARLTGDGGMSDVQRADLVNQINELAQAASDRQTSIDDQFLELANRRGVDRKDLRFVARPKIEASTARNQENFGSGTAIAAPANAPSTPPLSDLEKELRKRGALPKNSDDDAADRPKTNNRSGGL